MREGRVRAHDLDFAYLEHGEGPLVLLLHGFPDDALTFRHQMPALAEAGYRAVSVFQRGYAPTEIPANGYYDFATLGADAAALIEALGGEPAHVVGHDWGAMSVYGVCSARPDLVRRGVAMAVPHPGIGARYIGEYEQAKRSFYMFLFQVPFLPEAAVPMNDFAFVESLWRDWSPGFDGGEQLAHVKTTLAQPGVLEAALAYYRAIFDIARWDPALEKERAALSGPIAAPVMTMFGLDDGCIDPAYGGWADEFFTGPYERVMVPGAGHFCHLEQPEAVNEAILRWLGKG